MSDTPFITLSQLTEAVKGLINKINTDSAATNSKIGTLSNLATTAKTDIVSAVNEVAGGVLPGVTSSDNDKIATVVNGAWDKAAKPTYTAAEVGALSSDTVIPVVPTNVSSFTNDAGYITDAKVFKFSASVTTSSTNLDTFSCSTTQSQIAEAIAAGKICIIDVTYFTPKAQNSSEYIASGRLEAPLVYQTVGTNPNYYFSTVKDGRLYSFNLLYIISYNWLYSDGPVIDVESSIRWHYFTITDGETEGEFNVTPTDAEGNTRSGATEMNYILSEMDTDEPPMLFAKVAIDGEESIFPLIWHFGTLSDTLINTGCAFAFFSGENYFLLSFESGSWTFAVQEVGTVTSVNGQTGAVSLSIPSTASDVGAVASNQGSGNAGKFLVVGNDGVVAPVAVPNVQGVNF